MVGESGFEPLKSSTTDLQSAPFGHSGTLPYKPLPVWLGMSMRLRLSASGAGERTRTPDLLITNQLLYQLSYTSVKRVHDALGDPSEIRTPDTLIKSQVLCQLS